MGLTESIIKTITEPVNHLIDNCGHSDCKSKCGSCFAIDMDTHPNESIPGLSTLQAKDLSRDSILSNVTLIVDRNTEKDLKTYDLNINV